MMRAFIAAGQAAVWMSVAGVAVGQGMTPEKEYAKFVDRAKAVTPMTDFGDQINLRDGGVSVRATDVELKGIGPTIRITRTYNPSRPSDAYRETSGNGFGGWELEIPRIKTMTADDQRVSSTSPRGWQVSGATDAERNLRCSRFSGPSRITYTGDTARSWNPYEWWDGYFVVNDTGRQQLLMTRYDATVKPSFNLMTEGNWLVGCLSATTSGEPGEAFYAVAPDGTKYWFNYLVYRQADTLSKPLWSNTSASASPTPSKTASTASTFATASTKAPGPTPQIIAFDDQLERRYGSMLVTRIEDRFGNWVTYNYSAGQLTSIDASDGRHVGVTFDGNGRISVIKAGSGATERSWTYTYDGTSVGFAAMVVTQPDQSTWRYNLPVLASSGLDSHSDLANCTLDVNDYDQFTDGTITSPAGATMTLRFNRKRFARSYVYKECWGGGSTNPGGGFAMYPREWYAWALERRTVTGPGLPSMTWTYGYEPPTPSWYQDCATLTSCQGTAWTDVTDPEGSRHRSIFSSRFDETESKLLRDEVYSATGVLMRATDHSYATVALNTATPYPWPLQLGDDKRQRVNTQTRGRWTPERLTTITQQGTTFTRTVNTFDGFARPVNVTRASSLGQSLTEATSYFDQVNLWVLGQIDQIVANGLTVVDNDYDASTATLLGTKKFGVTQTTQTYNADGTLHTQADGAGHITTFSDWYRGFPQSVIYPTGASESAVVDERGWISSVTDAAGYTTSYDYDSMGRLASITPPAGFVGTSLAFEPVADEEFGLPTGHWRQTITHGNAISTTYFDGFWRPVMTRSYDAGDEAGTRKVGVKQYDAHGQTTYETYPARDIASVSATPAGTRSTYDALGRLTQVQADSELGVLTTTTDYLVGFQTRTTNPRGKATTQSFWALDDPGKAQLAVIAAPAGATVTISRDVFGKPTSITRGGSNGGYSSNVTRSYVYDAGQRLCKTLEPEVGATVQAYDAAGNIAWKAPGQNLPSTAACDDTGLADSAKLVYGYDPLNRLTSVTYGDGSPSVTRSYTPDGLLKTISSNGSTWTYSYNALRKLANETLNYGGQDYSIDWSYNSLGNLSTLAYPDGSAVAYSPNALGEAQGVSGYVSGVSYHPNGAVAGYTLANGVVHSLTQNTRGLPLVNSDAGVTQDQYAYDANGNVASITDLQEAGVFNRSMGYDDLDRLIAANAPGVWGSATYAYDTVDNLRAATVGTRTSTFNFGTNNQLASVTTNGGTANYGFDARGNLITKGAQGFSFDLGNRLTWSSLGGSYAYDGHGRRFRIASTDGSTRLQLYSQQGQLLWAESTGSGVVPAQVTYTCSSGTLVNGQCVTTTTYGATPGYVCNAGDSLIGSTCTHTTSSTYGGTATGYTCNAGDSLSGSTCTHTTTSTYTGTVTGYSCNAGDSLSGSTCTHTTTSTYTGTVTGYSCNAGDSLSGSTCAHTTSSSYGGTPTGYSCNAGDSLSGSTCTHTSSTAATASYSCPNGYSLSGTTCTTTTTTAATATYNCSPFALVAYASGTNGNACTEEVVASSSSAASQACSDDGATYGFSLIRAQLKSGKIYACYFSPKVTYSCPGGGTLNGSQCTGSSSQAATASYSCSTGTLSGTQCLSSSTYAGSPTGYSCNAGDSLSGSTCTHTTASTYTGSVTGYSCNAGDSLSGSTCTHTSTSTYTGTVTGYSCNAGDSLSGSTCTHTTSSSYGATPTGYSCNAGDSLSGSTCTQVVSSTYTASVGGYSCNAGDGLSGSTCTHTTSTSPTASYSCSSGTLSGSQCLGAKRRTAYIYLGGKQVAETSEGVTQYVHTDALGSPVAHTNSSKAVLNRSRFEPYGYVAAGAKPSPSTSVIGFTGHVQDAETDLVYMQQRYYDPIAGRFLSVDPVVADANTGQGFGLFTYVNNNPYAKVDPDGRDPENVSDAVAKIRAQSDGNRTTAGAAADGGASATRFRPMTGSGHHIVTNESVVKNGITSPEALKVLDGAEGRIPVEDHGKAYASKYDHGEYNRAVNEEVKNFLKDNPKIDPSKMTGDEAAKLLNQVKGSDNPRIREFNRTQYSKALQQALRQAWKRMPPIRSVE